MATITLLRLAGSGRILPQSSQALLKQGLPCIGATAVPKQTLMLTPSNKKRLYGPADPGMPSFSNHWLQEHYAGFALYPVIPLSIAYPHPVLDTALTCLVMLHAHQGLSGVAGDYVHTSTKVGPWPTKIAKGVVMMFSIMAFGSLCHLNYFDCGFGNMVQQLYTKL